MNQFKNPNSLIAQLEPQTQTNLIRNTLTIPSRPMFQTPTPKPTSHPYYLPHIPNHSTQPKITQRLNTFPQLK